MIVNDKYLLQRYLTGAFKIADYADKNKLQFIDVVAYWLDRKIIDIPEENTRRVSGFLFKEILIYDIVNDEFIVKIPYCNSYITEVLKYTDLSKALSDIIHLSYTHRHASRQFESVNE
jgi:hypothetical protein